MRTFTIKEGDKPSAEQLEALKSAKNMPIVFGEDCPELSVEKMGRARNKTQYQIRKLLIRLTGMNNREAEAILEDSKVYRIAGKGDEVYLHESYISNLLDIMNEFKEKGLHPEVVEKITPDVIMAEN